MTTPQDILDRLSRMGVRPVSATDDSRRVSPGDLFMAYPGDRSDGRRHIADAISRGASAVLWDDGGGFFWRPDWKAANLPVSGLRQWRAPLSHAIFGQPSERLSLIAVTGTNGKTSVAQWISRLYPDRCAMIGTLGAGFLERLEETGLTTPEAATLMRCLSAFAEKGAKACALEASSIGIEEGRLDGARVDVAVFTNLSRDHLDYHASLADYAAAKQKLFTWPRLRLAVINLDDPFGRALADATTASRVFVYSQERDAVKPWPGAVFAEEIEAAPRGLHFMLHTPKGAARVQTRLIGKYNVSNLLAVAAVLLDAGQTPERIAAGFADLSAPPGRLEAVCAADPGDAPLAVVDYAHTPDALCNALAALREPADARGGRLVAVFGCGGNRDRGKRPLMGEIAARLADTVVLTNDNPRNENPAAIIDDIRRGAPNALVIEDRKEAIRQAVRSASKNDVILIAGKGHERYQEIGETRLPFSDADEAQDALASRAPEVSSCP